MESENFLPIISYSLASFYLLGYIFFMTTERFPAWITVVLIGIPFVGRMTTPLLYSRFTKALGVKRTMTVSLTAMTLIALADSFILSYSFLVVTRLLLGVLFGVSTSASIEIASLSGNTKVIGLTMGGWAIGWIFSALFYALLGSLMFIPGILSISLLFVKPRRYGVSKVGALEFSWKAFIIFFLGFVPAYLMEMIPSMLGGKAFIETVMGYSLSLLAYLIFPSIKRVSKALTFILTAIVISGVAGFMSLNIVVLSLFTMLGLGLNSLLPILSRRINVEPSKIGPSMNLASFGGLLFPELVSLCENEELASSIILSISSILLLVFTFLTNRKSSLTKGRMITVGT